MVRTRSLLCQFWIEKFASSLKLFLGGLIGTKGSNMVPGILLPPLLTGTPFRFMSKHSLIVGRVCRTGSKYRILEPQLSGSVCTFISAVSV